MADESKQDEEYVCQEPVKLQEHEGRIESLEQAKILLDLARYSYQSVVEQQEHHWHRFRDMVTVYLACSGVLVFLSKTLRGVDLGQFQLMLACSVISWLASAVTLGLLVWIFLGEKFKYPSPADEIRKMIRGWQGYFDGELILRKTATGFRMT